MAKLKNMRDIATSNIKSGLIFRSESLHSISNNVKKELFGKYKIRTIVDLRTNQEHLDKKDKLIKGTKYIHLSLITMEEMGASSEKEGKRKVIKEHKLPDINEYYRRLVFPERKEAWTKIFNILLEEENAILFHCTVGKDRTGIVSAVILKTLGVSMEDIYKDYLLTNEHPIIPLSYKIFALSLDNDFRKEFMEYFKAKKEYLDNSFIFINEKYGSFDNFLKDICSLDEEKINKLKEKYLNK